MSDVTIDPRLLRAPPKRRMRLSWSDEHFRGIIWQILVVGIVGAILWWLWQNTVHNLEVRRIATGFGFLNREAGLPIAEQLPTPSWVATFRWWDMEVWLGRAFLLALIAAAAFCVRMLFSVPPRPASVPPGTAAELGFYLRHLGPWAVGLVGTIWLAMGLPWGVSFIEYTPTETYFRALLVGLFNTLKVASVAIVLSTILGTLIGIARLSNLWLLSKLAGFYVEVIRNLPLLLQLLFWYAILQSLPGPRQALNPVPGVFISNRGLKLPWIDWQPAHTWALLAFVAGFIVTLLFNRWATQKRILDGKPRPVWPVALALLVALPGAVWFAMGAPFVIDWPELRGFNFRGGTNMSPEYFALLLGLVLYTAGFIAEIVRAGILAVQKGQWEAAQALGLRSGSVLKLVVLPQALRVIIPPMTSQYLNVTKNSSLAVAIGYQDIVSIANTTLNQTGQAIEGIAIIMLVYLTISLSISLFMNWYNAKIALVER